MTTPATVKMRPENRLRELDRGDGPGSLENWRRKQAGVRVQEGIGTRRTNVGVGVWEKLAREERLEWRFTW